MALIRGGITVKRHVALFCDSIEAAGYATSFGTYVGHSPPEGPTQAVDIFNPDTPKGWALQDDIAAFAQLNVKHFGVRYVIRREHIWNIERKSEGWRWQGKYWDRKLDHYDHSHVTFYDKAQAGTDIPPVEPTKENVEMFRYWSKRGGQRLTNGVYSSLNGLAPEVCDALDIARTAPIVMKLSEIRVDALDALPPFPGE